jgi:eukaryotic-like serine/threonine-protein kinase
MRECTVCQSCFPDPVLVCDRERAETRTTLPIETIVNQRYLLKRRLGSGSVSIVYLATDQNDGSDHALKIIQPELIGQNSTVADHFLLQGRKAFALRHPNILSVTDSGLINNLLPFMTTDLVPGSSLHESLSKGRRISSSEALEYMTAIGAGLAHAHAEGVVHGDLKPRNILIQKQLPVAQAIKIADFGVSALKTGKIHADVKGKSSGILRSPVYLAPEEWSEDGADARSDIYSLGVILYQMLTGDVPFKGKSIPAIMRAHLVQPPPQITGRFPEVSAEIESVVLHALEKDPANRPATVDSFIAELREAVMAQPETNKTIVVSDVVYAEQETRELRPMLSAATQSLLLALGVVLVLTLIGVGVYYSRISQ